MTMTPYYDVEQRSDDWLKLRCGMVTASNVGQLVSVKQLGASAHDCPACEATAHE